MTVYYITLLTEQVTEEALMVARGVFYIIAVVALWALACAVRTMAKVATALLKALLVLIAIAALGAALFAIIAQAILSV